MLLIVTSHLHLAKELPQKILSHPYLIFRNQLDIKHFLFLLTFNYHWEVLYKPHCQWCWVKFIHAGHVILQPNTLQVMKQNIAIKLSNPINCQLWHHSCIQFKEIPPKMCHTPTLSLEISDILNIFYFY